MIDDCLIECKKVYLEDNLDFPPSHRSQRTWLNVMINESIEYLKCYALWSQSYDKLSQTFLKMLRETLNKMLNKKNAYVQYILIFDTSDHNVSHVCHTTLKIIFHSINTKFFLLILHHVSHGLFDASLAGCRKTSYVAEQVRKVLVYVGRHRRPLPLKSRGVRCVRTQRLVSRWGFPCPTGQTASVIANGIASVRIEARVRWTIATPEREEWSWRAEESAVGPVPRKEAYSTERKEVLLLRRGPTNGSHNAPRHALHVISRDEKKLSSAYLFQTGR